MKRFLYRSSILLFSLFISITNLKAQNLVPNPSFENTSGSTFGCPGFGNLVNWVNPDPTDSCSTPDLFSSGCSGAFGILGVPSNGQGNQAARTGTNYAGFIVSDLPADNYREYVETPLTSPLVAGQVYCVTFYVSLGDNSPDGTNRIGLYFSNGLTQFTTNNCNNTAPLPHVPQLQAPSTAILDKTNWVQLQWNYTAVGGENYITIGNFFNQVNTTLTSAGGGSQPFSYYYIDDVSITAGACCNNNIMPAGPFCSTDPSVTLTPQSSGGTWSGAGITNSVTGTFDPSVAGAGTHVISYSLACGTGTTNIVVNACASLSVCATGSVLTVSGGTPSYTWSTYNPGGSTPITTQAQCTACATGNIWLSNTCLNSSFTPVTSCSTAPSWQQVGTGTSYTTSGTVPLSVQDNAGNSYTITTLASVPSCTTCSTPVLTVNNATICAGSSATLTISGATTYSWIPATGLSSTNSATVTATPQSSVTYTILGTVGSCSTTTTAQVIVNRPPDVTASTSSPICSGNTIHLLSSGAPTTTILWNGPNSYTSNTANPTINNATSANSGTYTLTATGTNGCSITHTINVNVLSSPAISVSTASICVGDSGTLTASGANTYTWSTAQTGSSIIVTPSVTTTYTVSGSNANCTDSATVTQIVAGCSSSGINQVRNTIDNDINIYPNPSSGTFIIDTKHKYQCLLYDIAGKLIFSQFINGKTTIDAGTLSDGVYYISILNDEGVINKKLVIVK